MKIGVIGLGLIGGSFALAAKKFNVGVSLYGQDNNPNHMEEALNLRIIDHPLAVEDYAAMDVILNGDTRRCLSCCGTTPFGSD